VWGFGLLLGAVTIACAGRLLVRLDPPTPQTPSDVAYVLGGARVDRWLEAAELYQSGAARAIVISRGGDDDAERLLATRGIHVPTTAEVARDVLVGQLGIPADAVVVLTEPADNTAHEAELLRPQIATRGWQSAVIITAKSATRRAGFAFEREFGSDVAISVTTSRFDGYDPAWWFRSRSGIRETFYELPKLLAYWLGLGA
jgi:uncharacterized SAM-binding protein YcdF (DUF218 family)